MDQNKGYFQFPLCLLAFGEYYKERLETIVSYCVCEHARRTNPKFPNSARKTSLDEATTFLGVRIGSHESTICRWKEAGMFVGEWERRYGKDALVRIGTTVLWEAHDGTGLDYREFSILSAINSIIGRRRFVPKRITEPGIRVRAAGFKSWKVAQSELPSDESRKTRLLTADQVRYTLEKLHRRKFFARARIGAKTVKYMLGITDDQLRALLRQRETYKLHFKAERAKKDRELMATIKSAKRRPFNVGKDRNAAVSVPTQPRHGNDMIPDIVPDINICSFNNGTLNNGSQNICKRNKTPLSVESGAVGLLKKEKSKKLDRSQFSDHELAFIDLYHRICLPTGLGFLRVTQRSEELDKVLDIFATGFDEEEWTENFREAVEHRRECLGPIRASTIRSLKFVGSLTIKSMGDGRAALCRCCGLFFTPFGVF
jgi:hypothetical protein